MKSQMKEANRLNIQHTIIIGEEELKNDKLIIKNMKSGEQEEIDFDIVGTYFK